MSRKRELESGDEAKCASPFATVRDKELFEIERNILARFVYKNQYQFRRIDILERVKRLVKELDEFLVRGDLKMVDPMLETIALASERFFQNISMGLVLPISMVCVASMARLAEILRKVPRTIQPTGVIPGLSRDDEWDEGVPIAR